MPELFVIEGGDACGKTTQAKLLADALRTRVVGFPRRGESGSPIGQVLDRYLKGDRAFANLDPAHPFSDPLEDARVFQAMMTWDRYSCADLWDAPEQTLVLSRYIPSGLVFGQLDGIPLPELVQAHRGLPHAKIAFWLDLPVETQMERMLGRAEVEDRYEKRDGLMERLLKTRAYYYEVWTRVGPVRWPRTNWAIINGCLSREAIAAKILEHLPKSYLLHPSRVG